MIKTVRQMTVILTGRSVTNTTTNTKEKATTNDKAEEVEITMTITTIIRSIRITKKSRRKSSSNTGTAKNVIKKI